LTSGTFTSDDLKKFLSDNRVELKDVNFTIAPTTNGKTNVTFFVSADALPEGKTDQSVADDIKTSATAGGNQGTAYVLSGTPSSSTSFGNVAIVSLLLLFISLFM
jgi:hypothetical protein